MLTESPCEEIRLRVSLWAKICVAYGHTHPERSLKAHQMNTDGAIALMQAMCADLSDGSRKEVAASLGLL